MRNCKKCGNSKELSEFEVVNAEHGWRRWECKACTAKRVKAWNDGSREHIRAYKQQWHTEHREDVIAKVQQWAKDNPDKRRRNALAHYYKLQHATIMAYGGYRCACCGETEPLFLTLDHVNNDGAQHRRELGFLGGARFYKWLRDRSYPPGFQVLCINCNHGRMRNGGVCPHQMKA